jgi:membrane-associated phospholipid phosphatase
MKTFIYLALMFFSLKCYCQEPDSAKIIAQDSSINAINKTENIATAESKPPNPYKIKPWLDIPLTLAVDAWSIYGMNVIYNRDHVPVNELLTLNKNNINKFDRPIADNYSPKAADLSNQFFYGSMPLPLLFLLDKKIRKDGLKVVLLYLETMGITGTIYTASAMSVNRFRPYAYNPNVDMDVRGRGGARNSFFAGHVAVVASSTFFMAQVYTHYHPGMKGKWVLYSLAGAATATTGFLRLKAGQHFKTDVIVGTVVGTLVGNLVPHFHRNKDIGSQKLTVFPSYQNGNTGLTAFYKLGR